MNYKLLIQLEQEENRKLKQELLHVRTRNQELELRLKHKQQPKLLHVLNIFLLKQGEYSDKSK